MPTVDLTDQEWQTVVTLLAKQPWEIVNPILYKMARQGRVAMMGELVSAPPPRPDGQGRNWTPPLRGEE